MKKSIALLLILFFSLFADEFIVKSFLPIPNDITARRNVQYDINGDACALIKVRTDIEEEIQFDSNVGIPVAPEKKDLGEYWVYVVEGERALKCMAKGFIPNNIHLAGGGRITGNTVYELYITSKSRDVKKYPVVIMCDQDSTEKWIDGKNEGTGDSFFYFRRKAPAIDKEKRLRRL